jgi:hypothetical protein
MKVVATAPGYESRDEGEIPLWPNAPFVREISVIELKQGQNDLTSAVAAFLPQHERTSVWVTSNRYGRELGHLRYLVRYPYGCIEQTTSTLKPLLNVSALIQSVDPDLVQKESLEKKVMYGVRRLQDRLHLRLHVRDGAAGIDAEAQVHAAMRRHRGGPLAARDTAEVEVHRVGMLAVHAMPVLGRVPALFQRAQPVPK